jgi:hypothetical protein
MSWFSNVHSTLLTCNILQLLAQFSFYAGKERIAGELRPFPSISLLLFEMFFLLFELHFVDE